MPLRFPQRHFPVSVRFCSGFDSDSERGSDSGSGSGSGSDSDSGSGSGFYSDYSLIDSSDFVYMRLSPL